MKLRTKNFIYYLNLDTVTQIRLNTDLTKLSIYFINDHILYLTATNKVDKLKLQKQFTTLKLEMEERSKLKVTPKD